MSPSPSPDSRDAELRALLEQIAATAGDPPEHGLERVATLRRRRTRHRRRAVATTMALAVTAAATLTWTNLGEQNNDVSAASETDRDKGPTEPPDVLEVKCDATGIQVPVATIQPARDGLHIHVVNDGPEPVEVEVVEVPASTGEQWESGPVAVSPLDEASFVQPVAPGALTIGCRSADDGEAVSRWERRQVFLVDPYDQHSEPQLVCRAGTRSTLDEDLPEHAATGDHVEVVETALADYWDDETDEVAPLDAYPDQTFDYPTLAPEVRVLRGGEAVAFVRLDGDSSGPWESVAEVTACDSFLEPDEEEVEDGDDPGEGAEGDEEPDEEDSGADEGDEAPATSRAD